MEKRVVLAIGLTVGLYVVYFMWFAPRPAPPQPVVRRGTVAQGSVGRGSDQPGIPQPADPKGGPRVAAAKYPDTGDQTISNGRLDLTFASRGGALKSAAPFACANRKHKPGGPAIAGDPGSATGFVDGMAGALSVDLLGGTGDVPDLTKSNWSLSRTDDVLTAEFDGGDWVLRKTLTISKDPARPWDARLVVSFRNVSLKPGGTRTLEVVGPVQPPPAPGETVAAVLLANAGVDGEITILHSAEVQSLLDENPNAERRPVSGRWGWIGTRADFYLGALIPDTDAAADAVVGFRCAMRPDAYGGAPAPVAAPTFRLPLTIPEAGAETAFSFTFFAGPNQHSLLTDPSSPYYTLHKSSDTGGFLGIRLTWISQLLSSVLGWLANTGMGYGLAVISLTILVRGALFPLSRKSQISMRIHAQKMQRLKPKLDAVKEKYKDPKKQQEATMKVMREEKVSLLPGGCLLAFLQMPVWIALYGVLQSTFEMRHAEFLWVTDLTAPDRLFHMPFLRGVWLLPEWFNLLPLLMMGTWYFSAAMQPLPTDPQQASQAKMMRWMPVVMGVFLYGTAAGLTLYMTMSALWSIGETWMIRKLWLNKLEAALK